jgi:hypothetical protein
MLNRKKRYRALFSGYWRNGDDKGHLSGIVTVPFQKLNVGRKTKLEEKLKEENGLEQVMIETFQLQ